MKPYDSVVDFLLDCMSYHGDRLAVLDTSGANLSYSKIFTISSHIASMLSVECGKVAIAPRNTVKSVTSILGIWLSGSTAAIVDPLVFAEDFEMIAEESKFSTILVEETDYNSLCSLAEKLHIKCITIDSLYKDVLEKHTPYEGYWRPRSWADAVIYYYGGIVGRTTEVIHTHSSVLASGVTTALHYSLESRSLLVTPPLSHIFGLQLGVVAPLTACSKSILYSRYGPLDVLELLDILAKFKPNILIGVPLLYLKLLELKFTGYPGLEFSITGGAAISPEAIRSWRNATGTEIVQAYGMTEAAPISGTRPEDNLEGSIGKPVVGVEVRILNSDGRMSVEGMGELVVRGPVVMKGYRDPEDTRKVFLSGGWMRTGDIIEVKGGYMYFRGIRKRMIKYKGYPIFPADIEYVLRKHPFVAKVEVYGESLGELGEAPIARVWLKRGFSIAPDELRDWANKRMAPYKRLRRVEVVGEVE